MIDNKRRLAARQELLAAYRSGKYKQGTGLLHNITEDCFCALGVACDLFKDELDLAVEVKKDSAGEFALYNNDYNTLPDKVVEFLGFYSAGGVDSNLMKDAIWELNDKKELSFEEIANVLERGEHWRTLPSN